MGERWIKQNKRLSNGVRECVIVQVRDGVKMNVLVSEGVSERRETLNEVSQALHTSNIDIARLLHRFPASSFSLFLTTTAIITIITTTGCC